jgi:hypothetical protein
MLLLGLLFIILLQLLIELDTLESAERQSTQIIKQMPYALASSNAHQALEHKNTLSALKMHNALRFTAGATTKHLPREQAAKEGTSTTDTIAMKVSQWEQKFLLNMPD